jgi:hypothetical protein
MVSETLEGESSALYLVQAFMPGNEKPVTPLFVFRAALLSDFSGQRGRADRIRGAFAPRHKCLGYVKGCTSDRIATSGRVTTGGAHGY